MSEQYMAGDVFRQQRERDIWAARDAVVEAAPPEGWEVERYTRRDGVSVRAFVNGTWIVAAWNRVPAPEGIQPYFDTAREAMAALDTQKAPPVS